MKRTLRAVKAHAKAAPRRSTVKKTHALDVSPDEAAHLEQISLRYEEAERAWARMTAPPDGDDTWSRVEEHLLARSPGDQDRRWKFFSK